MASTCNFASSIWKNWDKTGKQDYLKLFKKCVSCKSDQQINYALYELVSKCVCGDLKRDQVTAIVPDLIAQNPEIPSILLDVLNILDNETTSESSTDTDESRQILCSLVKDLESIVPENLLKERLDIDTLQEVGTLKNRNFHTKFIRIRTKLYYKQKKFNLLREESEGYAKLITELNEEDLQLTVLLEAVKSLVGCFNLDPNRVLDLILEAFELRPEKSEIFVELLSSFAKPEKVIAEILGFKLMDAYRNKESTGRNLYILIALLLKRGLLHIDTIYPWLMPLNSTIEKEWEAKMKETKEYVRKLNVISTKDKEKEEPEPEKEVDAQQRNLNQKFGLCEALLRVGCWDLAYNIIRRLPNHCVVDYQPVATSLCKLIHYSIEPLYSSNHGLPNRRPSTEKLPLAGDNVPNRVLTFIELRNNVIPMLTALGATLHTDPVLMYKIIRLSKAALAELTEEELKQSPTEDKNTLYYDVMYLLDNVILPALSYMDFNCSIAEEVWSLIKLYPYHIRYCLYSRWKNDTPNDDFKLLRKNAEALKTVKNLMKRVSKENVKPVGRLLGKLTHACPGILFDYVLIQVQTYDNLIGPVVDSLKFLTSLSYDVLGHCIVDTLARASIDKGQTKSESTTISSWLQSLSAFCGFVFKKYNIELTGLLQYVANQLKDLNSLDLLILREIVVKMAGIETAEEMTAEQLAAMSGGELLKNEAGYFSQVRNTKKSSLRLKDALNVHDLGAALCLLMAQQRYCIVYRETTNAHLKFVGKLYDQCQDTLVQFGSFLCSALTVDEYVARFPSVHSMLTEFHINVDVAFFLARPTINHAINQKYESLRKSDPNNKKLSATAKHSKYCEAVNSVLNPLVDAIKPLHPPKIWIDLSPEFFVTFWSLSMYDLQVPIESYQKEINRLKQQSLKTLDSKEMTGSKSKKEVERYNALIEKLQDEKKKQQEHVERVMARLKAEKDNWFPEKQPKGVKNEAIMQFLQMCVLPRAIFNACDAIFCAKFIETMHSMRTANFSTVICFDRLLCDVMNTMALCTENEANRYGRFLCAILELVMRWHKDAAVFNAECAGTPGFLTKFRASSDTSDHVSYENYRHVCHKWHYKITRALIMCLDSKDYTQVRNALLILIKILPQFPVLPKLVVTIERKIEKVQQEEKGNRQDLYVLATSYLVHLKARGPNTIKESEFHEVVPKQKKESATVVVPMDVDVKKPERRVVEVARVKPKENTDTGNKEKDKENRLEKEKQPKEGHRKERKEESQQRKDEIRKETQERREDVKERDRERDRDRDRRPPLPEERWEEREDKSFREERYVEVIETRDNRFSNSGNGGYYYDEPAREMSSLSNSSTHSIDNIDPERDNKRRKIDNSSTKIRRTDDDWPEINQASASPEKLEKKSDRVARSKEKLPRKERKTSRKRERGPDEVSPVDTLRKEEEKGSSRAGQNGAGFDLPESSHRSKRVYNREKSPAYERERDRERGRSHDRSHEKLRDKHRRAEASKRR